MPELISHQHSYPKTLFICYGNVARSQMAEGWYNHYTGGPYGLSAGTNPIAHHLFDRPTDEAIAVMQEEGIDISRQPVKTLTPELVNQSNRVIVLCKKTDCPPIVLKHPNVMYHEVEDPFGKNIDVYRNVREEIRQLVQTLV